MCSNRDNKLGKLSNFIVFCIFNMSVFKKVHCIAIIVLCCILIVPTTFSNSCFDYYLLRNCSFPGCMTIYIQYNILYYNENKARKNQHQNKNSSTSKKYHKAKQQLLIFFCMQPFYPPDYLDNRCFFFSGDKRDVSELKVSSGK